MKNSIKPHVKAASTSLALLFAACGPTTANLPVDMGASIAVVPKLLGTLNPVNNSNIHGAVAISPSTQYKGTLAVASISGGVAGTQIPWRLNRGTCSTAGTMIAEQKNYPAFVPAPDGNANVEVILPVSLDLKQSYSVTVHSPSNPAQTIACADLAPAQDPNN